MGNLGYRKNQWNSQVRPGKTNRSYRGSNGIQGSDIGDVLDGTTKTEMRVNHGYAAIYGKQEKLTLWTRTKAKQSRKT